MLTLPLPAIWLKPPNTYIFLFNGRLQFQSGGVFGKYFYIGLFDGDKSFDAGLL
ncbi:hypothetical protein NEIELOOT_02599 [Neisseria elongata subsp. glycolytica ATCC 29315]|uniref:Uncharacterized protein n=1 Tax=Neisseria elongata subsp. glycolytica ATCC 29315 TaxID=546263 RepID=D4DU43_NEIEG|nr:hypothetical protein NEIELOOT_02599 [Neisseria elongata subsp. glycolytica ATCC 29315]